MNKICATCKYELKISCFSYRNKAKGSYASNCKECHKKYIKMHYETNKKLYLYKANVWKISNNKRRKAIAANWAARNKYKIACNCCTQEQFLEFYEAAENGYHVDHIISFLDGGIHCRRNMQYLSPSEHGIKSCRDRYNRRKIND